MSKIKKPLALLLSLLMLMTAMPLMAISASAVTASQLDFVLSHLPNERNAHYYKDSKQLVEDAKEAINAATSPEAVDTAGDNGLAAVEHKQQEEGFTVPDLDIQLGYRETAPVNAESTTNKIIFTSSNEKVVTVDEDGNLKAVGKGTATITATLEGTDISEEIEIEVSYTFWDALVWHIRNLLELIASGFKWLLGLIGINL